MMKKNILIALSILFCTASLAQNENKTANIDGSNVATPTTSSEQMKAERPTMDVISTTYGEVLDSLHLPTMNNNGQVMPINMYPLYWGGWNTWNLHSGLNLNLSASVFAEFGKNARHGAGFSQSISAMYAMPLNDKLSLAVGGYFNNIYWAHDTYRDAGLNAVLGYKFDEHWEAYLYGQKSIVDNQRIPYSLYDMHELGDRIGAAVKYNFSPSFSVQISVEHNWMPKQQNSILHQYNFDSGNNQRIPNQ